MLRSALFWFLSAILLSGCVAGMHAPPGSRTALAQYSDPAVRRGVLENGLTFFIRQNAEPRGRAELRLVVNAGSILEDDDQRGLAHVVEHMAFNGTRNFERQEIVDYLESIGMRFGPDVNAYTSFDETVYTLTLPTDSAGVLERGIQILEDWAWGVTFDSLQVEKERGVVIEEWRLAQGAAARLQNVQFPIVAHDSRYAERNPIGTPHSLANFTHDSLRRFYHNWYRPDLMAIVAVGDFEVDEVEALIRSHFERIPAPVSPRPRTEYPVPGHRSTLISMASDRELSTGSISLYVKKPPRVWRAVSDLHDWVIESLAGSMLVNRLSEYGQLPDSPLLDVSSFQGRFVRSLSVFVLNARIGEGEVERGLETLLMEIDRVSRHGFTGSELDRQKVEMLRAMDQRYSEREKISSGSYAAEYVGAFLNGGSLLEAESEYQLYRESINRVRLAETNARGREWGRAENRVILVGAPEREGEQQPSQERLARIAESAPRKRIEPYADAISEAPLLHTEPMPGQVVAERSIAGVDALEWQLSNGSSIILKPTDFRHDEVLFAARSPGGTSLYSDEDYVAALTATAVVQSGGLGELSTTELRKRLAGRLAGVGAEIGERHEGLSGAASPRDLETLFQLVYLKFTAPRVDSIAFRAYQAQARATLLNRSANPDVEFQDTVRMVLAGYHPRARPATAELFDSLDLERSFEIFRERFADAGDFTFFLLGNFDPETIRPYVERYLASLPATGRVEAGLDVGIRPPSGVVRRVVRRGMEPRAVTQIVFTGAFAFERTNILAMQSLADVLRIRLRENLREELSGTYGVNVRGTGMREPVPQFQFSIAFGSDPERLDELVAAVFSEIADLKEKGPSEAELAKVRETQFRARETDLRQNHFWMNQFLIYHQFDWDLADIPPTPTRSTAVASDLIRDTARRYLDPSNYVQVTLLPEARSDGPDSAPPELPR